MTISSRLFKILLPVLILSLGVGAAVLFKKTAPRIGKQTAQPQAPAASVMEAAPVSTPVFINAQGLVVPSREITLKSLIPGTVDDFSPEFAPGGLLSEGDSVIWLAKDEYAIEVRRLQGVVAQAQAEVDLEQGQQTIAEEAYDVLSRNYELPAEKSDLLLRKPNLQKVLAGLEVARAQLDRARLDLERTTISAPFDCLVTDRAVSQGSYVNANETLGTLAATDVYWVELSLPLDRFPFLKLEGGGQALATVRAIAGPGEWQGRVLRPTGSVVENSRMAKVLVAVDDPLGRNTRNAFPLMLGDWVDVTITGRTLPNVYPLPRAALRDNDTVWVCSDDRLDIRDVTVVWRDVDFVYVSAGLEPGELVVVSDLSAPVQAMALSPEPVDPPLPNPGHESRTPSISEAAQ